MFWHLLAIVTLYLSNDLLHFVRRYYTLQPCCMFLCCAIDWKLNCIFCLFNTVYSFISFLRICTCQRIARRVSGTVCFREFVTLGGIDATEIDEYCVDWKDKFFDCSTWEWSEQLAGDENNEIPAFCCSYHYRTSILLQFTPTVCTFNCL